jgi:ankyrin repeat protein
MSTLLKKILRRGSLLIGVLAVGILILDWENLGNRRARAFRQAASNGNLMTMRGLLLLGASVKDDEALNLAAGSNQVAAITFLLDRDADVNATVKVGWTALMSAAYYRHLDTAKLLVARGADVNRIGDSGTALDLAIEGNKAEIIELLKQNGAKTAKELRSLGYN